MSVHTLEAERQAILARMKMRRENYRRMLVNGDALDQLPVDHSLNTEHTYMPAHAATYAPVQTTHATMPASFPRSGLMRLLSEHPFYCALGVAAIIAIGPRRITRKLVTGGAALTNLTARSRSNLDVVGRLLALAAAYVQGRDRHSR